MRGEGTVVDLLSEPSTEGFKAQILVSQMETLPISLANVKSRPSSEKVMASMNSLGPFVEITSWDFFVAKLQQ